ncbi:MAG: beta-propeller fold lactonase family protein [Acidobacteriota bacterium]
MKPSKLTFIAIALVLLAASAAGAADRRTARVYVTNSKGNDVTVIDPATMKVVGSIIVGANPHGIVLSPDRRTLYISVEGTDELVAVDAATNQIKWRVKVGRAPNEVSITRDGRKVFVPLRNDAAIDVVDTTTMKVIDRMKAPAWPHNTYVSADGRRLYLGSMAGSRITIYDTATHKQINEIAPGDWVRPIALRRDEKLAYVALSKLHGFVVVDLKEGKTIRRVELPALPPGTVIPPYDTLTHGLALTPDERELYVTSMAGKAVYAFSVPDLKQLAKIDVGRVPNWITISPDGRLVWVSNQLDDTVSAIDPRTKKVVATIPVGHEPKRLLAVDVDDARQSSRAIYYPPAGDEWEHKRPEEAGMDSAKLEDAMQFARASETTVFSKDPLEYITRRTTTERSGEIVGPTKERAPINVVVLRHGYIVAEFGDTRRVDMSFSAAKSFVSTTVGLAFDRGLIKSTSDAVGKNVKDGGYDSTHNAAITWHESLQQTSEWEGTLWDKPDTFDRRRGRDRQLQEHGSFWEYNDVRVNRVALSSLRVWKLPLPTVLKEMIMDPIGASDGWQWNGYRNSDVVIDGKTIRSVSGGGHWGGGMWISSRDLARFGYLFLRNGKWKDRQLISEKWIAMATTPCELKQDYGYMWWLNTNEKMYPGVPANSFAALGAGTNISFVDPVHDLVVVVRWVDDKKLPEILRRIVASVESVNSTPLQGLSERD